jgi:hypothetical protein
LKRHNSPCSDEIPAEVIQSGGEILCSKIHKLINSIWNKEELPDQWKESLIVPIYKKGYETVVIIMDIIAINFIQNCIQYPSLKVKSMYK